MRALTRDELVKIIDEKCRHVDEPPFLRRLNGVGLTVLGNLRHPALGTNYVVVHWFTFIFLPILPIGYYLVTAAPNGGWYFKRKVSMAAVSEIWGQFGNLRLIAGSFGNGLIILIALFAAFSFVVWIITLFRG